MEVICNFDFFFSHLYISRFLKEKEKPTFAVPSLFTVSVRHHRTDPFPLVFPELSPRPASLGEDTAGHIPTHS